MNPADKELLVYWIRMQKRAERDAADAKSQGRIWFRRAQLAKSKGESALAEKALEQAVRAREDYERAEREVERAKMERDVLKSTSRSRSITDAGHQERAEHALEEFRQMGIDPKLGEFERLEREEVAREARERLRERADAESDSPPAPGMQEATAPPDDALRRLKERMNTPESE